MYGFGLYTEYNLVGVQGQELRYFTLTGFQAKTGNGSLLL